MRVTLCDICKVPVNEPTTKIQIGKGFMFIEGIDLCANCAQKIKEAVSNIERKEDKESNVFQSLKNVS